MENMDVDAMKSPIHCKNQLARTVFPNNMSWICKSLKRALNLKKLSYYAGDNFKIKYKSEVEDELNNGNSRLA